MSEVVREIELVEERAREALARVSTGLDALTLAESVVAVEMLGHVVERVGQMAGALVGRVEVIREREVTERREGPGLEAVDTALMDLAYGRDGLRVARHLLARGRGELLRVERGEV